MLIQFWISDADLYPFTFAANHIVAIEVAPYDLQPLQERHDIVVHANTASLRFPKTERNMESYDRWVRWVDMN